MKFGNLSVREDTGGKTRAFFCNDQSEPVNDDVIHSMTDWTKRHDLQELRICLHENKSDRFHQMIILQHNDRYRRPHKEEVAESYHMIYGSMIVVLFDVYGKVSKRVLLSIPHAPIFRMNRDTWHVNIPVTPTVIFHETKVSLNKEKSIEYPRWAPTEEKQGLVYMRTLLESLGLQ